MTKNIILVCGVHGVGKSSLCKQLSAELGIDHITASNLISQLKKGGLVNKKQDENIEDTQNILITALYAYTSHNKNYLLDGHFCLLDINSCIHKIPSSTFQHMKLKAVILLHDDVLTIQQRLKKRDAKNYDSCLLKNLQECEITHAQKICDSLNLPLLMCGSSFNVDEIKLFIKTYI